jgi:hypothetical protein
MHEFDNYIIRCNVFGDRGLGAFNNIWWKNHLLEQENASKFYLQITHTDSYQKKKESSSFLLDAH